MKLRLKRLVFIYVILLVIALLTMVHYLTEGDRENKTLKEQVERLREERERMDENRWLVCNIPEDEHGMTGELVYLDCGESFVPRYATCLCTLMCMDDYSMTYNSLSPEDCPNSPVK